jgi:OST-HTH/LOTUS domain
VATRPVSDLADSAYSVGQRISEQKPQPDRTIAATKTYVQQRERPSVPEQQTTNEGVLRSRVFAAICDLIEKSLLKQRPLYLPLVGKVLGYQFPGEWPVHNALGFRDLTDLILSFEEFAVTGEHPKWLVSFREDWQTTREKDLRYDVWSVIKDLLERRVFENRPLYLPAIGYELSKRLPQAKPVHHHLGFDTLSGLIESFDDFAITGEHPRWVVEYRQDRQAAGAVDLRSEVASLIRSLIEMNFSIQRPLLLVFVGIKLAEQFPETKPVHKTLGFATLTDLVVSFDEFTVMGGHPRWVVQFREVRQPVAVEDLRYEVITVISDLLDRSNLRQLPLHLPFVGLELAERFPESKPVHRSLGFETLTDLIRSFDDFSVTGEHPRWIVQYQDVSTDSPNTPE